MKLSLTVEANTINVLALNAGRIAVGIDGIELADLINVVCDNGYSLRVADEPGKLVVEDPLPPVTRVNCIQCSTGISRSKTMLCYLAFRTSMKTLAARNGLAILARVICSTRGVVISGLTPQTSRLVESLPSVNSDAYPSLRRGYCSSGCLR